MTAAATAIPGLARHATRQLRRGLSTVVDRYLRIVTVEQAVSDALGGDLPGWAKLRPFGWTGCWRVLRRLGPTVRAGAFVDVGCGAGRMVCAAARYGYTQVVGVEIRPELVAVGRQNIARLRGPHGPCEIIEADAETWAIPDNATVVFLYNPFVGTPIDGVVARIRESCLRAPREIIVAYANPIEHKRIAVGHGLRPTLRIHVGWRPGAEWRRTQAVQLYTTAL